MKLSQIKKRVPQTLTNSKDIIQEDREHARRSSRARSTRGQQNEAWALYKKNASRESRGDLSEDRYIICPKPSSPAGKILDRRQLFFLANHISPEQKMFSISVAKCAVILVGFVIIGRKLKAKSDSMN